MSNYFRPILSSRLSDMINMRVGEMKLGEMLHSAAPFDWRDCIRYTSPKYVIIGIPEDIGVRANGGVGGAHTAWSAFVKSFLNIQSTPSFTGEEVTLLGAFDFEEYMTESQNMDEDQLRKLVNKIDEEVQNVISFLIRKEKIPIIIGGGHNNSYPIIKGVASELKNSINCINLDAHSDYRSIEGRHSGNGFRYAKNEGYLDKYAIVGLHQNYNSESVIADMLADEQIQFSYYEGIFLNNQMNFDQAIQQAIDFTKGKPTGIELDVDCIQNVLSSAITPVGITVLQARQYLTACAQKANPAYLHIAEAATLLANGRQDESTGKLIACLVSDFIKASLKK
jgi:formiminoglutamase